MKASRIRGGLVGLFFLVVVLFLSFLFTANVAATKTFPEDWEFSIDSYDVCVIAGDRYDVYIDYECTEAGTVYFPLDLENYDDDTYALTCGDPDNDENSGGDSRNCMNKVVERKRFSSLKCDGDEHTRLLGFDVPETFDRTGVFKMWVGAWEGSDDDEIEKWHDSDGPEIVMVVDVDYCSENYHSCCDDNDLCRSDGVCNPNCDDHHDSDCDSCSNACTGGTYRCNGNNLEKCYDSNNDRCAEWNFHQSCENRCSNNACNDPLADNPPDEEGDNAGEIYRLELTEESFNHFFSGFFDSGTKISIVVPDDFDQSELEQLRTFIFLNYGPLQIENIYEVCDVQKPLVSPTLEEHAKRFVRSYCGANRNPKIVDSSSIKIIRSSEVPNSCDAASIKMLGNLILIGDKENNKAIKCYSSFFSEDKNASLSLFTNKWQDISRTMVLYGNNVDEVSALISTIEMSMIEFGRWLPLVNEELEQAMDDSEKIDTYALAGLAASLTGGVGGVATYSILADAFYIFRDCSNAVGTSPIWLESYNPDVFLYNTGRCGLALMVAPTTLEMVGSKVKVFKPTYKTSAILHESARLGDNSYFIIAHRNPLLIDDLATEASRRSDEILNNFKLILRRNAQFTIENYGDNAANALKGQYWIAENPALGEIDNLFTGMEKKELFEAGAKAYTIEQASDYINHLTFYNPNNWDSVIVHRTGKEFVLNHHIKDNLLEAASDVGVNFQGKKVNYYISPEPDSYVQIYSGGILIKLDSKAVLGSLDQNGYLVFDKPNTAFFLPRHEILHYKHSRGEFTKYASKVKNYERFGKLDEVAYFYTYPLEEMQVNWMGQHLDDSVKAERYFLGNKEHVVDNFIEGFSASTREDWRIIVPVKAQAKKFESFIIEDGKMIYIDQAIDDILKSKGISQSAIDKLNEIAEFLIENEGVFDNEEIWTEMAEKMHQLYIRSGCVGPKCVGVQGLGSSGCIGIGIEFVTFTLDYDSEDYISSSIVVDGITKNGTESQRYEAVFVVNTNKLVKIDYDSPGYIPNSSYVYFSEVLLSMDEGENHDLGIDENGYSTYCSWNSEKSDFTCEVKKEDFFSMFIYSPSERTVEKVNYLQNVKGDGKGGCIEDYTLMNGKCCKMMQHGPFCI